MGRRLEDRLAHGDRIVAPVLGKILDQAADGRGLAACRGASADHGDQALRGGDRVRGARLMVRTAGLIPIQSAWLAEIVVVALVIERLVPARMVLGDSCLGMRVLVHGASP